MILRTTLIWPIRQLFIRISTLIVILYGVTVISACTSWLPEPHKLDLQQGNTVKLEQLESIEIGMNKSEVRKIMGSPMLALHPL